MRIDLLSNANAEEDLNYLLAYTLRPIHDQIIVRDIVYRYLVLLFVMLSILT